MRFWGVFCWLGRGFFNFILLFSNFIPISLIVTWHAESSPETTVTTWRIKEGHQKRGERFVFQFIFFRYKVVVGVEKDLSHFLFTISLAEVNFVEVSMSFAKLAQIFFFYADNDMIYQATRVVIRYSFNRDYFLREGKSISGIRIQF